MNDYGLPRVDPLSGFTERLSYDEESKSLVIARTQDVSAILDANKASANENSQEWRKKPDRWMLFASIPNAVIEAWLKEGINVLRAAYDERGYPNDHMVRVLRKLDDPDWRYLKTTSMRMS